MKTEKQIKEAIKDTEDIFIEEINAAKALDTDPRRNHSWHQFTGHIASLKWVIGEKMDWEKYL